MYFETEIKQIKALTLAIRCRCSNSLRSPTCNQNALGTRLDLFQGPVVRKAFNLNGVSVTAFSHYPTDKFPIRWIVNREIKLRCTKPVYYHV